ncbi:MAG: alpha/beta hydrolase fold domain-containing protein [Oscillospiraceae bacterium]|nr:alpha/beta hydrolase fold domain-containing protein [Oscillospiraceae bacterium]
MTEKFFRSQLSILKPKLVGSTLEQARKAQDLLGDLMAFVEHKSVRTIQQDFPDFSCEWVIPDECSSAGVILYLHGGGYTCGGLEYARGFGSKLASEYGLKVFCCAYRLAPENKFPAALDDALASYKYLIDSGFPSDRIILAGESAGGGLCYSLCLKLNELGLSQPAGIIAISPWTDLTASGDSIETNKEVDPTLTIGQLNFYTDSYTDDRTNPYVSPLLFEEGTKLPPSLIFVGSYEILLDDSTRLHQKLLHSGNRSKLIIADRMWHAYVLYDVKERKSDYDTIRDFIGELIPISTARWVRLDNAAKIFPASKRKGWYNMFRVSVELDEKVDPVILQSALNVTIGRFPTIAARLKTGFFWYYLEELKKPLELVQEGSCPFVSRVFGDVKKCAIRVLYYNKRIAIEFFHAVTDGTGGIIFLKTLLAEYFTQKYDVRISAEKGVLSRQSYPEPEEIEDSFLKNRGNVSSKRDFSKSYRLNGTAEPDGFINITTGTVDASEIHKTAKSRGVTITAFLAAVMVKSIIEVQKTHQKKRSKQKLVRVQIPVNLRKLFPSKTMRNFSLFINVGVDPRMGDYELDELVSIISHQLALKLTKKNMQAEFTPNVNAELVKGLKIIPLFIKNIGMRIAFYQLGEGQSCLSISNLGIVDMPDEIKKHVRRFDIFPGVRSSSPYNCGVCTYGNEMRINFVRSSIEPELERAFFTNLVKLGIKVTVESNRRDAE